MIPGTAIPTTRLTVDDTLQRGTATQKVSDSLSDFQPGQRLVATIQSQLANGTYRAIIAQRDVTLALPFSAKAGEQLKLEVVDTRGRVALALAKDAPAPGGSQTNTSTTTTLSHTGQIIGTLFTKPAAGQVEPQAVLLNRGQPMAPPPAQSGAELAPALQKAVAQSGVFYESHQAAWIAARYPKAELLREPLANLPRQAAAEAALMRGTGTNTPSNAGATGSAGGATNTAAGPHTAISAGSAGTASSANSLLAATANTAAQARGGEVARVAAGLPNSLNAISETAARGGNPANLFNLPADVAPLVHQQLNALATNVYAWQGLAWANQRIEWEVVDEDGRREGDDDTAAQWQTRLSLTTPALGEIDALIRLRGNELEVSLRSPRVDTRQALAGGLDALHSHLSAIGLALTHAEIEQELAPPTPVPADETPRA